MATKYNYSNIAATAKRLIDKFGRDITKNAITNSGTEWNPIQSTVSSTITAVFTNFSKNEIDGTLIKATDKKLLCYDKLILTDTITDDGITYSIVPPLKTINPGNTKIIYIAHMRR